MQDKELYQQILGLSSPWTVAMPKKIHRFRPHRSTHDKPRRTLYNAGHFLQLLEGKPIVVRKLFEKICRDKRHRNVQQFASLSVEARLFESWSMGLINFEQRSDIDSALFRDFRRDLELAADSMDAQRRSLELLKEFKRHLKSSPPCVST